PAPPSPAPPKAPAPRPFSAARRVATPAPALSPPAPPPPPAVAANDAALASVDARDEPDDAERPAATRGFTLMAPRAAVRAAPAPPAPAARLRAAAAAGRTAEVGALLAQGVPVDAPDADGETALMESIQW